MSDRSRGKIGRHRTVSTCQSYKNGKFSCCLSDVCAIVTRTAHNDSGLFETYLRDERYLPFEGAGALSQWRIELPASLRPFDMERPMNG